MRCALVRVLVPAALLFCTFLSLAAPAAASAASAPPARAAAAPAVAAVAVAVTTVTARRGDSLSSIARRVLGSAKRWPILWWDNQAKVPDPDVLPAGTRLRYGSWHWVRPWLWHRALAAIPKPPPPPAPAQQAAPAADPVPAAAASYAGAPGSFQACVIRAESGGNPAAVNPSSGAGGLYQFLPSTWAALGYAGAYPGGAQTAPVSVQEAAFAKLYAESGTSPWAPYDGCL